MTSGAPPAPLRILVVGAAYPPHGRGGYEQQCADAVAALRARGDAVRVLTAQGPAAPGDQDVHRALVRFAADPAAARAVPRARALADEEHNRAQLARHLADHRPDVVCWWRMGELSMGLLTQVRDAGLPAVGVVCDTWPLDGPARDPWQRHAPAELPWTELADWLLVSGWLREHLAAHGLPVAGAPLAEPGVDPVAFPPRAGAPPWRGDLLVPGRRSPLKGAADAVAALAHLPGARLTLVGDGTADHDAALHAQAAALGVADRVTLAPAIGRGVLAARLAAADAVLFPVRWSEPWGLVPLEAMSTGVPVVTTATGGSASYTRHGENALVVDREDPGALAAAVGRLEREPGLRARLVAGGHATAAAHPAGRAARVVLDALDRAATRALAPRPG